MNRPDARDDVEEKDADENDENDASNEPGNKDVDAAWSTLAGSLDPEVHAEQTVVIEKLLWDTLYGIPLYAHPGLVAYDSTIKNVRNTATQDGVSWNAGQWMLN